MFGWNTLSTQTKILVSDVSSLCFSLIADNYIRSNAAYKNCHKKALAKINNSSLARLAVAIFNGRFT
jgi:hypothetical protein